MRHDAFEPLTEAAAGWLAEVARRFPPYSEFSLASLEAWRVDLAPEIARLPDGVMLRLRDVQTGERFVTILGGGSAQSAVEDYLAAAGEMPLRLVPAAVAGRLDPMRFSADPEPDHFDYVVDAAALAGLRGNALKHKRGRVNKLFRDQAAVTGPLDLAAPGLAAELAALFAAWSEATRHGGRTATGDLHGELTAMLRLAERRHCFRLVGTEVRVRGRLVAASIAELVHDGYAILHFSKALGRELPGANEALMQATARSLLSDGCRLINIQEDLGLAGLREAKLRYKPVGFLEKLRVTLRG